MQRKLRMPFHLRVTCNLPLSFCVPVYPQPYPTFPTGLCYYLICSSLSKSLPKWMETQVFLGNLIIERPSRFDANWKWLLTLAIYTIHVSDALWNVPRRIVVDLKTLGNQLSVHEAVFFRMYQVRSSIFKRKRTNVFKNDRRTRYDSMKLVGELTNNSR